MSTATEVPSLASIKRRFRIGMVLEAVGFRNPKASGHRTIIKVGATGFWWGNSEIKRTFTQWPKASCVVIESADTFTLMMDDGVEKMTQLTIVSEGDGPVHEPKKREHKTYPSNMYPPIATNDSHGIAQHKARYTHAPWIAYHDGKQGFAAKATAQNIQIAMDAVGPDGKFSLHSGSGFALQGRRKMAETWKSNAEQGWLS